MAGRVGGDPGAYPASRPPAGREPKSRRHHGCARTHVSGARRARSHSALVNRVPARRCLATHSGWAWRRRSRSPSGESSTLGTIAKNLPWQNGQV